MVHGGNAGVVDEHIQPAFLLSDLREHSLDRRFVANVEAVVPIVREFPFKLGPAAPDHVAASASVMLDQSAADALPRTRDQDDLVLSHCGHLLRGCRCNQRATGSSGTDSLSSKGPARQPTSVRRQKR